MANILVLCVDRDDDLGEKAKITGPVVGRESNLEAAKELGVADPAESDTNAIHKAVNVFDNTAEATDVVTITGDKKRGYKADKEIASQLDEVLREKEDIDGVYLVTDGSQDDQIIPIIQSRTDIVSKETVIVEQSQELEKSYYVIKEALKDPTIARIIFGLPGIVLLIVAVFQELGVKIVLLGIGAYLTLKGFGIEEKIISQIRKFKETTSVSRATFPLYIGSLLTLILAIWSGLEKMSGFAGETIIKQGAAFVGGLINLLLISGILFLIGRIGDRHSERNVRKIKKHLLTFVSLFAIWFVFLWGVKVIFGEISLNTFILFTIVDFLAAVVALAVVRRTFMKRYVYPRIEPNQEVYDPKGRKIGAVVKKEPSKDRIVIYEKRKNKRIKKPINSVIVAREYLTVAPR